MSELLNKIRKDWLVARKNRDVVVASLLGTLVAQVETERKSKNVNSGPILDSQVSAVIKSFLKKAEETHQILLKAGNNETSLIKIGHEISILKSYLPKQVDEFVLVQEIEAKKADGKSVGEIMGQDDLASDYLSSRERDFRKIVNSLSGSVVRASSDQAILAEGDSLELLRALPTHSISLILTDPPYHSTKKRNIHGDTSFNDDQHYLDWMSLFAIEWRRILKPNGSLYCFCASEMAARLERTFSKDYNILSQIVWTKPNEPGFDGWKQKMKKESLRQWYAHTERVVFAEPAAEGNLNRSPFANFLRETRKRTGLSTYDVAEIIGAYGRVNHGGAVSNWEAGRNTPSRKQYAQMCAAFLNTGRIASMPPYEDVIRPFRMDGMREFTDVWNFPSVRPYSGKHPAEKPSSMLEHIVESSSYPGDIVLDTFAGSGSTALAALRLGRRTISMEIDPRWVSRIAARLQLSDSNAWNG